MKNETNLSKAASWIRELILPRKQSARQIAAQFGFTLLMMMAAFGISAVLNNLADNLITVPLVFVLAVLLTAWRTEGYFYSVFASLVAVFAINFCFTYPYFEFNFTLTGYPVTFLTMFAVSMIVGMLTDQVKRQSRIRSEAEKEKMRANLLRAISHDLRTPLTSIIGTADSYLVLQDTITNNEKNMLVEQIHDDANWLLNMVENLLTITRIKDSDTTTTKVVKSQEVLEEVIAEALQRFRKRHPETSVKVTMPDDFIMIPMDPLLIEQVILNLLDNASVHSDSHDSIELLIIDNPDTATICVRDYGKGIDPELLPNIFDGNSSRNHTDMVDSHRGMGIGLSICKTIIDAHSGTITAHNHENGAEFFFTLPKEELSVEQLN